ncbi:MAG: hypothetical protein H0W96_09980 [Solirubrobacterales bacterium]|nr:hypothetical protein [Solirubrobacterales bacterium]
MRIGTWNLAHERNASPMVLKRQLDFMEAADCDIWLLSEVPYTFRTVTGPSHTALSDAMDRTHSVYAAVWAKAGIDEPLAEIHEAAALARVQGRRVCSSLLPWHDAPLTHWPDKKGADRAAVMQLAIGRVRAGLSAEQGELIWGGEWSHAFAGEDTVTTDEGRQALEEMVGALGLQLPTAALAHTEDGGRCTLSQIAVPSGWNVTSSGRLVAENGEDGRLSRHDAYVVDVEP